MRITVAVQGHLHQTSAVGPDELTLFVPDAGGLRVRDLLEPLNIWEEEIGQVLINGRRGRVDSVIRHRTRLEFLPKRGHARRTRANTTPGR